MVAAVSLLAGVWAAGHDADVQTAVFLTLGLGQLSVAVALRAPRSRPAWRWRWHERGLSSRCCSPQPVSLPELWRHPCRGCLARRPLEWPASSSRSRWRRFRGSSSLSEVAARAWVRGPDRSCPWHLCWLARRSENLSHGARLRNTRVVARATSGRASSSESANPRRARLLLGGVSTCAAATAGGSTWSRLGRTCGRSLCTRCPGTTAYRADGRSLHFRRRSPPAMLGSRIAGFGRMSTMPTLSRTSSSGAVAPSSWSLAHLTRTVPPRRPSARQ